VSDNRDGNSVFTAQQASAQGFSTRNVMKDDFGMEVPVESVPLPSEGKIYSSDSSSYNKETIEIRAMTAREEDILTSRALIKKGTVISELLRSCIVDKSIDVEKLISGDRNALMTAIRITGYGSEYKVEVNCPECDEKNSPEFQLSELPIKRLAIDPISPGENAFEYELPISKKKVVFRFLTGKDETNMSTESDRRKKKKLGGDVDNIVTSRLLHSIISIDGIEDKNKISLFVRNMPAKDSRSLRKFMDDNEPGIEMKAWMTCDHCYEQSEVSLPIGASFFWPDA
tara:strand:+ start:950 stop:1804 length:855 start_codon:yes stop_codon:yes gene_type:complete